MSFLDYDFLDGFCIKVSCLETYGSKQMKVFVKVSLLEPPKLCKLGTKQPTTMSHQKTKSTQMSKRTQFTNTKGWHSHQKSPPYNLVRTIKFQISNNSINISYNKLQTPCTQMSNEALHTARVVRCNEHY